MASDVEADGERPAISGRRRLDRRTLLVCLVVALLSAALAGVVTAKVLNRDDRPEASLTPTRPVSDVPFTRFDDSVGNLTEYAGQSLVVNFFSSTCVSCRKEMPDLEKVQVAGGDHVTIVGIAVQDDPAAAAKLVKKTGVTYDIGQDPTGKLFNASGGTLLPFTIFVASDGTIMQSHTGALSETDLQEKISANLLGGG